MAPPWSTTSTRPLDWTTWARPISDISYLIFNQNLIKKIKFLVNDLSKIIIFCKIEIQPQQKFVRSILRCPFDKFAYFWSEMKSCFTDMLRSTSR